MAAEKEHKVGIYVRLSNEDARAGESVSIENQKLILTKHVKENGWELIDTYIDDGFSGTNQNRPALQKMLADVRSKRINTLLIKDLSRLGRNYLEVGNLAEVLLPEHGCELISLNEKVDEMMVFRNWLNEQHSKDTSKKVRAVKRMCAKDGKFIGSMPPFGFCRDPENKHRFVIDEPAAAIVRKIFQLRAEGKGYKTISYHLNEAGIISPNEYFYQQKNSQNPRATLRSWSDATIRLLLNNEVYIGNMVQGKSGTVSYKNSKLIKKAKEDWIRSDGTHEGIIPLELWECTRKIGEKRYQPRPQKNGDVSIFSGILVCADCGYKMRLHNKRRTRADGSLYGRTCFICGSYARCGKTACTTHLIGENDLMAIVAEQIRSHAQMVQCDEERIVREILRQQNDETETERANFQSELKSHKNRLPMLNRLIEKLYEDRLVGTVPETVFRNLIQKYEQERVERQNAAQALEKKIRSVKQNTNNATRWAGLIKPYARLETLDAQTIVLLVDRIAIGDTYTLQGKKTQDVKIIYNYVGDIDGLCAVGESENEDMRNAFVKEAMRV